ncbi:hypothetical protein [Lentilactobacillus hilgardii]|uniref:hypothetical protein n=1 Tax=Lentilactobacillus hilgardii TaxID=1588 RepID=UPI003FA54EAE
MATPNVGILTNAGKNLIDQVNAGQTKITFSKIVFSSMNNNQLTDDQIKALTTVAPQEIVVNNPKVTLDNNTGETRIRATGNNEALTDGVYVKTYAVYAKDDSGNEILYGITVSPNPNYLPEYDGVTPQAVTYSYKVNISNTSNITFANSNDIYVSDTDLAEALQPYAKTVDVNQQLDKKVTDNHDNTITANNLTYDLSKSGLTSISLYSSGSFNDLPLGTVFASASVMTDGPDTKHGFTTTTFYFSSWSGRKAQIAIADNVNLMYFRVYTGIGWTSWTLLSDDSKVVHSTDMRKPASDVAGIEEVNAKQDKIGYTPADDSNVVHDNHDGRISANGASILPANEDVIGRIDGIYTDMNDIPMGWLYLNGWSASGLSNWGLPQDFYYIHCFKTEYGASANIQIAYGVKLNNTYVRTLSITNWTTWKLLADDSKVAHLSGANNFDTVPTVNNNPLLLASSLPSDLARTGSDQEFTGKNTFDTAPIDKTTGNPYITKDGVPTNYAKDNYDGTITANGTVFNLLKSLSASSIPQDPTKDYNTLPQGLAMMTEANGEPANMPPVKSSYLTLTIAANFATGRKRQLAWLDAGADSSNNNYTYIRYCVGSTWSSWDSIPTSTQISSLIPSTIADTTKLANFTAGLQSGGVSVATSDDLKSVENSAWHQLSMPDCTGMEGITLLYRNFISDHYMNLYAYGTGIPANIEGSTMLDLSSLIDKIESVSGVATGLKPEGGDPSFLFASTGKQQDSIDLEASENKLILDLNGIIEASNPVIINGYNSPFAKVNYDNWIGS